jgi:DNA polymerase sigma
MKKSGYQYDLVIYGSSANALALRGDSDLDLSLIIHNLPKLENTFKQAELIETILSDVISVIKGNPLFKERFKTDSEKIVLNSFGYLL